MKGTFSGSGSIMFLLDFWRSATVSLRLSLSLAPICPSTWPLGGVFFSSSAKRAVNHDAFVKSTSGTSARGRTSKPNWGSFKVGHPPAFMALSTSSRAQTRVERAPQTKGTSPTTESLLSSIASWVGEFCRPTWRAGHKMCVKCLALFFVPHWSSGNPT